MTAAAIIIQIAAIVTDILSTFACRALRRTSARPRSFLARVIALITIGACVATTAVWDCVRCVVERESHRRVISRIGLVSANDQINDLCLTHTRSDLVAHRLSDDGQFGTILAFKGAAIGSHG